MASGKGNLVLENMSEGLAKQFVVKNYGNKIVLAKYPRAYKRKQTELKDIYENRFAAAIKYARAIRCNDELYKQYQAKVKPGQRVYNYAISEYLQLAKSGKIPSNK